MAGSRENQLAAVLVAATSAPETIEAIACLAWAKNHDGADCTPEQIPKEIALIDFACKSEDIGRALCPQEDLAEAEKRLKALWPKSEWWAWIEDVEAAAIPLTETATEQDRPQRGILSALGSFGTSYALLDLAEIQAAWIVQGKDRPRPLHPLGPIIQAWQQRLRPASKNQRQVMVTARMSASRSRGLVERPLTRSPGMVQLASVPIDGQPFVSKLPGTLDGQVRRIHRLSTPQNDKQRMLWPGPRRIDKQDIQDPVIATLADMDLTGDERLTIRGDLYRVALLAYALSGTTTISEDDGARWLTGGGATKANKRRWLTALDLGDSVRLRYKSGHWFKLLVAEVDQHGQSYLAPPKWWTEQDGSLGGWRLAGGLWRPALLGDAPQQGTTAGYWGGLHRTIAGLEAALTWGRSAGKGKGGRIPNSLKPERKGGPGPVVFFPWRIVLTVAGEHVEDQAPTQGSAGRRYRRRVDALEAAGYVCLGGDSSTAPAGDTVEIVQIQRGQKHQEGGLYVRATDRFCAAYAAGQDARSWEQVSAEHILK